MSIVYVTSLQPYEPQAILLRQKEKIVFSHRTTRKSNTSVDFHHSFHQHMTIA